MFAKSASFGINALGEEPDVSLSSNVTVIEDVDAIVVCDNLH